jgi:hypothetical protein
MMKILYASREKVSGLPPFLGGYVLQALDFVAYF